MGKLGTVVKMQSGCPIVEHGCNKLSHHTFPKMELEELRLTILSIQQSLCAVICQVCAGEKLAMVSVSFSGVWCVFEERQFV